MKKIITTALLVAVALLWTMPVYSMAVVCEGAGCEDGVTESMAEAEKDVDFDVDGECSEEGLEISWIKFDIADFIDAHVEDPYDDEETLIIFNAKLSMGDGSPTEKIFVEEEGTEGTCYNVDFEYIECIFVQGTILENASIDFIVRIITPAACYSPPVGKEWKTIGYAPVTGPSGCSGATLSKTININDYIGELCPEIASSYGSHASTESSNEDANKDNSGKDSASDDNVDNAGSGGCSLNKQGTSKSLALFALLTVLLSYLVYHRKRKFNI